MADIPGLAIDLDSVESNIVYFEVEEAAGRSAKEVSEALAERGVSIGALGPRLLRAVTHLDVAEADVDAALEVLREVMESRAARPAPAG